MWIIFGCGKKTGAPPISMRNLQSVSISSIFSVAIAKRITDALSRFSNSSLRTGNVSPSSVNISVSRERRHLAASRDFSLRFSLFLFSNGRREIVIILGEIAVYEYFSMGNVDKSYRYSFHFVTKTWDQWKNVAQPDCWRLFAHLLVISYCIFDYHKNVSLHWDYDKKNCGLAQIIARLFFVIYIKQII